MCYYLLQYRSVDVFSLTFSILHSAQDAAHRQPTTLSPLPSVRFNQQGWRGWHWQKPEDGSTEKAGISLVPSSRLTMGFNPQYETTAASQSPPTLRFLYRAPNSTTLSLWNVGLKKPLKPMIILCNNKYISWKGLHDFPLLKGANSSQVWWRVLLILSEFKAILVYRKSSKIARATERNPVSKTKIKKKKFQETAKLFSKVVPVSPPLSASKSSMPTVSS